MLDKTSFVILGYSGHAFVVADIAMEAGIRIQYYADKQISQINPFELEYLGYESDPDFPGWSRGFQFVLGIGDNGLREKAAFRLFENQEILLNIIHPGSGISKKAELGSGIFVSRNVSVNSFAEIGNYCILNTGCIIEHECKIGSASHIAPGAVLAGNVIVGERSFIGVNSVVKQGVNIGKDAVIGAGSVIICDIPDGGVFAGNPAKSIK